MKVSSIILLVTFTLLIAAMFVSNVLLKKEYDKLDKSDTYWTYGKILEQPFKHLKIEGGNVTRIAFEPSKKSSVRVFKNWEGFDSKAVKAFVKNDTLYLKFPNTVKDPYEKEYLQWFTMVRIFSPELLSIEGYDTNLGLFKLKQKNISINLSGKSKVKVESYIHDFDNLQISQRDSSHIIFEISPDFEGKAVEARNAEIKDPVGRRAEPLAGDMKTTSALQGVTSNSWETMYVKSLDAKVNGVSLLDVGRAQIGLLKLDISDTSGIILSGGTLRKFKR